MKPNLINASGIMLWATRRNSLMDVSGDVHAPFESISMLPVMTRLS